MKKRRIKTLDEIYAELKSDMYKSRYKKSLSDAHGKDINLKGVKTGRYSLKKEIEKYVREPKPSVRSMRWLYREVFKNPTDYRFTKKLLNQGMLYTFHYFNPKYKGTSVLPWFDKYPLVLSLGPVVTKEGIRNIGLNLHLLPPKVRIIVLCYIFEYHKKLYRYQIYYNKPISAVPVSWQQLVKPLLKYGITFCIRMYIPNRMASIVQFKLEDWYRAVFVPSRAYDGIRAQQLIKEWKKHIKIYGYTTSPNVNWKI